MTNSTASSSTMEHVEQSNDALPEPHEDSNLPNESQQLHDASLDTQPASIPRNTSATDSTRKAPSLRRGSLSAKRRALPRRTRTNPAQKLPLYQKPIRKHAVQLPQFDFHPLPHIPERDDATGERVVWRERNRIITNAVQHHHKQQPTTPQQHNFHRPPSQPPRSRAQYRTLTADFILSASMCTSPHEVMELFLSNRRLNDINEDHLLLFQNVYLMELGDNWQLPLWKLRRLPQLREMHVPCNALEYISFQDPIELTTEQHHPMESHREPRGASAMGSHDAVHHQYADTDALQPLNSQRRSVEQPFTVSNENDTDESHHEDAHMHHNLPRSSHHSAESVGNRTHFHSVTLPTAHPRELIFPALETLNLSHNNLHVDVYGLFYQLSLLPALKRLNLASNEFTRLPEDLSDLRHLVFLSVEGNYLTEEAFYSLSTIPNLEKLNASRNKIRRVPRFGNAVTIQHSQQDDYNELHNEERPIVFPQLKMLSLGENLITYHEDLYNLLQFQVLEQIFIWSNPVCDSTRELELATQELSTNHIQIILNGPIPPPTKELSVKNFYNHKLKTIKSYEYVTRKKMRRAASVQKPPSAPQAQENSSSFFITETSTVNSEHIPESDYDASTVHDTTSSIHVPHVLHNAQGTPLTPLSTQYRGTTQSSMRTTTTGTHQTKPTKRSSDHYDYNADWFKLDSVLQKMSVDQNDPFFMDDHSMSMRVGGQPSKATKVALKDLKFALDHPLKTVDDRFMHTRFAMGTKSLRQERKKARDDNVDRFYQSARGEARV